MMNETIAYAGEYETSLPLWARLLPRLILFFVLCALYYIITRLFSKNTKKKVIKNEKNKEENQE